MDANNKLRIFLVDDDKFCMNLYTQHLNNLGYNDVVGFENGMDCLNNLSQKPDIIFLDHGMDYLTGLQVLKKLRKENKDIIVIFLSGQANVITGVKALKAGAIDYIVKGINELGHMSKVLDKINESIKVKKRKDVAHVKKAFAFI